MKTTIAVIALLLAYVAALLAEETTRFGIQIQLRNDRGRAFRFRGPMSPNDYRDAADDLRRATAQHVRLARQAMAEELGYTRARYGEENWKMLSDPEVVSISLWDKQTRRAQTFQRPFDVRRRGR